MFEINTSIVISAAPEEVWQILTDFKAYPEWNPFVSHISGLLEVGEKLDVIIDGQKFNPILISVEENKEFAWKGKVLFNGLFDAEHIFQIHDNLDGTSTFVQKEYFSGLLVRFFKNKLDVEIRHGFENMNLKLKSRVENP